MGISPVTLEPPPPPLRCRLDQEGSFEATGPLEALLEPYPREYSPALEKSIVSDLNIKGFRLENPSITDLSASLLIKVVPPEVTSPEQRFFR
jgi:hypothetical protein